MASLSGSQSQTHTGQRGGCSPSLHRVTAPPQGPPLRAEAAEVATPAESEGGGTADGVSGEKITCSLCYPRKNRQCFRPRPSRRELREKL